MYGPGRLLWASVVIAFLMLLPGRALATHWGEGDLEKGEIVYNGTCVACHGETGKGEIDGVPDLTKPDGRLSKSDHTLVMNITEGFQSPGSYFEMPAMGGDEDLEESDIVDVLAYLRKKFGSP